MLLSHKRKGKVGRREIETWGLPGSRMRKPGGGFLCVRAEQHNPGEERESPVAGKGKPESEDVNQSGAGVRDDNGGLQVKGPRF